MQCGYLSYFLGGEIKLLEFLVDLEFFGLIPQFPLFWYKMRPTADSWQLSYTFVKANFTRHKAANAPNVMLSSFQVIRRVTLAKKVYDGFLSRSVILPWESCVYHRRSRASNFGIKYHWIRIKKIWVAKWIWRDRGIIQLFSLTFINEVSFSCSPIMFHFGNSKECSSLMFFLAPSIDDVTIPQRSCCQIINDLEFIHQG